MQEKPTEAIRHRKPVQPLSLKTRRALGLRGEAWSEVQGGGLEKAGKNTKP